MITPFDKNRLRPAGYELSVGSRYSKAGKNHELRKGEEFTIEPFEVAIIQTLETIIMPPFLIGRWNIKVGKAYEGLLWVGGPQVDAGFQGYLCCPLYNLSDSRRSLRYGDQIAVIDFITTTPPAADAMRYDNKGRPRRVFSDYHPERLQSALIVHAKEKIDGFEGRIRGIQDKIDTFATTTFTVIALLFAVLGLAVSRGAETSPTVWTSVPWLSAISFWFAIQAYFSTRAMVPVEGDRLWSQITFRSQAQVLGGFVLFVLLFIAHLLSVAQASKQLSDLRSTAGVRLETLEKDIKKADSENETLRKTVDALRRELLALEAAKTR